MTGVEGSPSGAPAGERPAWTVDHVASAYRCYPGETVIFHTRVTGQEAVSGYSLSIALPAGLEPSTYRGPARLSQAAPRFLLDEGAWTALWEIDTPAQGGVADDFDGCDGAAHACRQDSRQPGDSQPRRLWPDGSGRDRPGGLR